MSNFEASENSDIVPQQSKQVISFDEFKAFYYQLNAKPDTDIRLLRGRKVLELADIRNIYERVGLKLDNHDTHEVLTKIPSINLILSNGKIKDYSAWHEFSREDWDTVNNPIQTVSINWDFVIKLPNYESPQRHSMKLRIGPDIPPKDLFQLIFTSDDISQLLEAQVASVCKVDFINNIIATELLYIVSNWYEGLEDCPATGVFETFIRRKGKFFSQFIRYIFPVLLLIVYCIYSSLILPILGVNSELYVESLQIIILCLVAVFMLGSGLGVVLERFIDQRIDQLKEHPRFSITRGDKLAIKEYKKNNDKLTKEITNRIFWIVVTIILSTILKPVINYFLGL